MKSNRMLGLGLVMLGLLVACGDDGGEGASGAGGSGGSGGASGMGGTGGGGTGGGGATGEPTWTAIYADIITGTGCNGGALCHGGIVGNLTMTDRDSAYDALVDVAAMGTNLAPGTPNCVDSGLTRVVPGDADASLLVQKVEGTQTCGMKMGALTAAQITQLRTWIDNGALND